MPVGLKYDKGHLDDLGKNTIASLLCMLTSISKIVGSEMCHICIKITLENCIVLFKSVAMPPH